MEVKFEIPEELLYSLNESKNEFIQQIKLFAAIQFYQKHKLSLGKAAELSGMQKYEFMLTLGKYNIPVIDYPAEELDQELMGFKEQ